MDKRKNNGKKLRRRQLDSLYQQLRPLTEKQNRSNAWLRDIRQALGLSSVQYAKRMGISKQAYLNLESSEEKQTIKLATLSKAAEAIGFQVIYALIPRNHKNLDEMLRARAEKIAARIVNNVAHSMALEDQAIAKEYRELQIADLAEELVANLDKRLWDEDGI